MTSDQRKKMNSTQTRVLQYPARTLLKPSTAVRLDEVDNVVARLKQAFKTETGVLGMAAPQIGINKKVFIARGVVYANPKILELSHNTRIFEEACFSVNHAEELHMVMRHLNFVMSWLDERGFDRLGSFSIRSRHDEAHVIQHEYDHLQGILINMETK